jgi:hypothetical protein
MSNVTCWQTCDEIPKNLHLAVALLVFMLVLLFKP